MLKTVILMILQDNWTSIYSNKTVTLFKNLIQIEQP